MELYHRHTPRTCYNIAALAHQGYYDGEYIPLFEIGFYFLFVIKPPRGILYSRRDRATSEVSLANNG